MKNVEELLRSSLWGQSLTEEEMLKALAGTSERSFSAGGFICAKGEPVDYWMGIKYHHFKSSHAVRIFCNLPAITTS